MPRPAKISRTDINVRALRPGQKPPYLFAVTVPQSGGRRQRKFFRTRLEAEGFAQLKRVERANHGAAGAALSTEERGDFLWARERLSAVGATLREAVELALPILAARSRSVPVEQAVADLLKAQQTNGASRRHLEDLRSRLGQFVIAFGERPLAGLTSAEVDQWVRGLDVAALTRNQFRRVVSSLFSFGVRRGWVRENVVLRVDKAKVVPKAAGILRPEQIERLLTSASPESVPALAVSVFAGVRRAEVERLSWEEIHFGENAVEIRADKAKSARRRFIRMEPALVEWLTPHARPTGPLCPVNWRVRLDEARAAAGLTGKVWPANCLRHTFASCHIAHFQDAGRLAAELGHTTPALIYSTYRALVPPSDAGRFWAIRPAAGPANVVPLVRAVG